MPRRSHDPIREELSAAVSALPWTSRRIAAMPVPVVGIAGIIALAWLVFAFAVLNVVGGLDGLRVGGQPFWEDPLLRYLPAYGFMMGWVVVSPIAFLRAASSCAADLQPVLAASTGDAVRDPLGAQAPSKTSLRVAGGLGVLLVLLGDLPWVDSLPEDLWPEPWLQWLVFALVQDIVFVWFAFRGAVVLLAVGRRFSALGAQVRLDVVDLRPIAPFSRLGLRLALWMLVGFAWSAPLIGMSLLIESSEIAKLLALAMLGPLVLGAIVLILPTLGVRRAILRAKEAELDRVRGEIAREREVALGPTGEHKTRSSERLPGLLAYEERVLAVRGWPFDVPVVLRFALYALLPMASWIAAAFVERALNLALE